MKRWGILVTALYLAALVALTLPLFYAALDPQSTANEPSVYLALPYWIVILVLICAELLLLFVPVHYTERRPQSRRPLLVPIVTSALLMGVLTFLFFGSILLAIWGDDGPPFLAKVPDTVPGSVMLYVMGAIVLLLWVIWGIIFYRRFRTDSPERVMNRATTWLLRGSIAELLVAVSCHVIVRRRDDCCAPLGTFIGIAAGLSLMLMSFGPGIIFLFAARKRKLQPKEKTK